jgi:hypothetical protein
MDSSVVGIIQLIIDYAPERHKIEMRPEPQRTEVGGQKPEVKTEHQKVRG